MKQETAAQINSSNRELMSLQSQLHDALERKKGIENQPLLVLPAVATAPPKPPGVLLQAVSNAHESDSRPAKVARTKQTTARAAPAPAAAPQTQASSQSGPSDEATESRSDFGVPPTVRSARQAADPVDAGSRAAPPRGRPKPNPAAAGPPGTAARIREKPKTAARTGDEAMNVD